MAKYKNEEHFNINGDKTVEVVIRFDMGEKADDRTTMLAANDYLEFFLNSQQRAKENPGEEVHHKAYGRSIEVRTV